jgi:hypothetical protein
MSVTFAQRLGPDTIRKLEDSAPHRIEEARQLRDAKRHLAAVYLLGYSIEMRMGAAYFRLQRLGINEPIDRDMRRRAIALAQQNDLMGREPHELIGWARLLVFRRATLSPPAYADSFGKVLVEKATAAYNLWRPCMRYRHTDVPLELMEEMMQIAEWFGQNCKRF